MTPLPSLYEALLNALDDEDSDAMPAPKRRRVAQSLGALAVHSKGRAARSKRVPLDDVKDAVRRLKHVGSSQATARATSATSRLPRAAACKDAAGPAPLRRVLVRTAGPKNKHVVDL
jgi:hypothetical protein